MVVDDFDVMRVSSGPAETDTPLFIDADAVLPPPIARQLLEAVRGRDPQVEKAGGRVQDEEFAKSGSLKVGRQPADSLPIEEALSIAVSEAANHVA